MVNYTPWRMSPIWQTTTRGSRPYYGNFCLGLEFNSHPRFREYVLNLIWFSVGIEFRRDALVDHAGASLEQA